MITCEPGTLFFNRYEIIKLIGAGGTGAVYLACDPIRRNFKVALKIFYPGIVRRQDARERFKNEIIASYIVNSPNVVRVFEYFDEGETQAYAMEYVDGGDLLSVMQSAKLTQTEVIDILMQVASGLQAIHSQNIIHRDLKPDNILLASDKTAKIVDFGVARLKDSTLTQTGSMVGTPRYIAPEYIRTSAGDHRGDIYALGVIGYELILGEPAFKGETPISILIQQIEPPEDRSAKLFLGCPRPLASVIAKAMCHDPDNRYQSSEELRKDLELVKNGDQPSSHAFFRAEMIKNGNNSTIPHLASSFTKSSKNKISERVWYPYALYLLLLMAIGEYAFWTRRAQSHLSPSRVYSRNSVLSNAQLGAKHWFKAQSLNLLDGSAVSEWRDSIQIGLSAEQQDPTRQPTLKREAINGLPALNFDGKDDFLEIKGFANQMQKTKSFSAISVARTNINRSQMVWAVQHQSPVYEDIIRQGFDINFRIAIKATKQFGESHRFAALSEPLNVSNFSIITVVADRTEVETFHNGVKRITLDIAKSIDYKSANLFSIGQEWDSQGPSDYLNGEVAELLIFYTSLTDKHREEIEQALGFKYAIPITSETRLNYSQFKSQPIDKRQQSTK